MADRGDRKPQDRTRAPGGGPGAPSGPRRTKAGELLEKRSAVVGQRKPRRDDVPIPGRTPTPPERQDQKLGGKADRHTAGDKGATPPAKPRTPRVFKAGEKPAGPRKKRDDE